MIKNFVILLFIFNIIACNPAQQLPESKTTSSPIPFTCLASQSRCDISTEIGKYTVEFSAQIDEGKVKTELPFQIKLTFAGMPQGSQLKSVSSYLEGKSMFMGKIPILFQETESNGNSTIAETLLVSCSEEIMTWRIWFKIDVEQVDNTVQQDFFIDFESKRL